MRRLLVLLAATLLAAAPGPVAAQFGRNEVQYRSFDFEILRTEHFDVYFCPEEREAALDAGRMAERAYARLSRITGTRVSGAEADPAVGLPPPSSASTTLSRSTTSAAASSPWFLALPSDLRRAPFAAGALGLSLGDLST